MCYCNVSHSMWKPANGIHFLSGQIRRNATAQVIVLIKSFKWEDVNSGLSVSNETTHIILTFEMPLVGAWSFLARLHCKDFLNSYYCMAKVFIFHFIPKISSLIWLRACDCQFEFPFNWLNLVSTLLASIFYFVLAANAP